MTGIKKRLTELLARLFLCTVGYHLEYTTGVTRVCTYCGSRVRGGNK